MSTRPPSRISWPQDGRLWALLAAALSLALFLSTLQWQVNGSQSPYATDVGEIQNALPRWGTIHFTGYPLYTLLGSLFVSLLRWVGIEPAAGASLYSALWGALAMGWLTLLLMDLGIWPSGAVACTFLFALSRSLWIDASLAEIHTLTLFLTVGSLHLAWRYGRGPGTQPAYGSAQRDLLWLVVVYTQGLSHQRAMLFLAPTLLILVWPRWREMLRAWRPILGLTLLAALVYLYLPLRHWMGADWTFNAPGTWGGFWSMFLDTKAGRIIDLPASLGDLSERLRLLARLLHHDLALPVLLVGGLGLLLPLVRQRRREALAWLVGSAIHLLLCLVIWEGRVSDALLAAKLPLVLFALIGLAYLVTIAARPLLARVGIMVLLIMMAGYTYGYQRPQVLAITRDASSEFVIAEVERLPRAATETVVWALWGHDYWALRYAQTYRGQLQGLTLVDHNAYPQEIVGRGARLVTPRRTFYHRPVAWWEERLGPLHLQMPAADLVEITPLDHLPPPSVAPPSVPLGRCWIWATAWPSPAPRC